MTLQDLKAKATASELTLIDRVEALVAETFNADDLRGAARDQVREDLRVIGRGIKSQDRHGGATDTELLGRAVYRYLKENE